MIHQPPAGARDLFPLEVAQKCWINDRLQQIFARWGYQRIVTSTIEWLDTLMAGGAIERSTVIQLQDNSEGTLGLRPELTASIARAAVTRLGNDSYPQRLCYRANVFRQPPTGYHGRQLEFYQAGVELLFAGGVLADAEIILLLADSLAQLGLQQWHLILGNAGLTRSLLSPFPEPLRKQVRDCIVHLDRVTLETLSMSLELQERALLLFDLRGQPADVLQQVARLELDEPDRQRVNDLKTLIELIERCNAKPLPLTLDLSLLQPFDYYTGVVFEAVSFQDNQTYILGQGGRYDQLLALYHPKGKTAPGIGFCLNIEELYACLLATPELPNEMPVPDWLVVPQTAEAQSAAFIYAQTLRNSKHLVRVEIYLDAEPDLVRDYARSRMINRLAWVQPDGTPVIETLLG